MGIVTSPRRKTAVRSGCLLWVATAALVSTGCATNAEGRPPGTQTAAESPGQDPTAERTGNPAPHQGRPGYRDLPVCRGGRATILGSHDDDRIAGTRGQDVIVTFGGDDVVTGIGDRDSVCTGAGDDLVRSKSGGSAWGVELGLGDDRLRLVVATNVRGGRGADRIVVERDPGYIQGGPGADYLRSITTKQPSGYPENAPCVSFADSRRAVHVNLDQGWARGAGRDQVVNFRCVHGTPFGDTLVGSALRDGIYGKAGYDVVRAGGGNDTVSGGLQADRIYLGPGFDYGNGDQGWDRIYGQGGPDSLEGWSQGDYLDGGAGNDQIYAALFCSIGGNSYDTAGLLDGAPSELFGGPGDDYLVGDKGNDRLDGGEGYDVGQGGYHDGRIDWIESTEVLIDGCLDGVDFLTPYTP